MPLGEFRRRFHLLAGEHKITNPVSDERKAVEDMLLTMDLESSSYRVGLSLVSEITIIEIDLLSGVFPVFFNLTIMLH